jgi:hypothetical protein
MIRRQDCCPHVLNHSLNQSECISQNEPLLHTLGCANRHLLMLHEGSKLIRFLCKREFHLLSEFQHVLLEHAILRNGAVTAGLGIGAALPCRDALITEGIDKKLRGTITSLYSSMRFIGVAAGPPVTSLLLGKEPLLFYTFATIAGVGGLCALFAIKPESSLVWKKSI